MTSYTAPLRDMKFQTDELLEFPAHYQSFAAGAEATPEMVDAILNEAAKFSENVLAPLNRSGDEEGCHWENGQVTTPTGFKEAYEQYTENGWSSLSSDPSWGGQGLPVSLGHLVSEMQMTANHAWVMYPGLTLGAIHTLSVHGTEELKQRYLPKLVSGEWSGTMCLTESHSGSDLGLLRTKATANADGSYSITGGKIFISSGQHDLTSNIVHLVLARLPDAPPGIKGISLFVCPRQLVDANGELIGDNNVNCASIEHKMGIHGNSTCVMNFDGAKAWLIGTEHKGMSCMFTFINESRLGVAQQGLAHIEGAYQTSLAYAKDRVQFRSATQQTGKDADPIIVHPDIRRLLLTQKAFAEGGRALNYFLAKQADVSHCGASDEEKNQAEALLALLTPIAKGFLSEVSIECTNHGVQILGGHGFIREWGQEQHCRDTRITAIYEGTTGIQGLDLLGRKVLATKGKALAPFFIMIEKFCAENPDNPLAAQVKLKRDEWEAITRSIGMQAMTNPDEVNAAAVDYLMFAGYVTLAYFWARSAVVAQQKIAAGSSEEAFYKTKISTANFYFQRILPRTLTHVEAIKSGAQNLMEIEVDAFV